MIETALGAYAGELSSAFLDPRKRVFWGYLASACLIGLLWLVCLKGESPSRAASRLFARSVWLSRSALSDYRMMALNSAVMLVLSPRLLSQLGVAVLVFEWMHGAFGGRPFLQADIAGWAVTATFTVCLFVLDDFTRYVVHRMLHRIPWLWSFHKVHHTATTLNPLTVYRTHPVEGVIFVLRAALVQGACTGAFVFFFGDQVTLATVAGASVFSFAFNALGANLRHSHVALGFWRPVERVIISPAQHQIHHSVDHRHLDRNFGVALAVWDWMFKTHCFSEPGRRLRFGVDGDTSARSQTLTAMYWQPFIEAGRILLGTRRVRFLRTASPSE